MKTEVDEGLRTGYISGLVKCLASLSSVEKGDKKEYIRKISDLIRTHQLYEKHGQKTRRKLFVNPNSGLPSLLSLYNMKEEIDSSRKSSYLDNEDAVLSLLEECFIAEEQTSASLKTKIDNLADRMYKSELKGISRRVGDLDLGGANIRCKERQMAMFCIPKNDYNPERDGRFILYNVSFDEPILAKVNGNMSQVSLSKFLTPKLLLDHLNTEVGITPVVLEESVVGPFAYSGIHSLSDFREICDGKDGSFVLHYSISRFTESPHKGEYKLSMERFLFCSPSVEESILSITKRYTGPNHVISAGISAGDHIGKMPN